MKNNVNQNKNVLIVSNCSWYLYNFRDDLLNKLEANGYSLILLSPLDKYYKKISKYFKNKENLFLKRGSENPLLEILTIFHIFFVYVKYKPDIVHHFTIKPCLYGSFIARLLGIKITINHITGLGPSFYSNRAKIKLINKILYPIFKYSFNKKDNLINIFHNNSDKLTFIDKGIASEKNTRIVQGSGVNINYYAINHSRGFSKEIKVLFPARIIKEKGIIELVHACKNLWQEEYNFTLNIAGEIDKQNKSHLKNKHFQNIINNKNIIFLGKCENMLEIYKTMDIVVLPSWREGLSKSLLEAAAMELPIITTNVPGCRDIIKDKYSGLVVAPKNEDELKLAIKNYLENPNLAIQYGKNARKTILEEFNLQLINRKILSIYEEFNFKKK